MSDKKGGSEGVRTAGMFAAVGIEIAVPVAVGALAGNYLDKHFGLSPLLMILLTGLGAAIGFLNLWRLLKKSRENEDGP